MRNGGAAHKYKAPRDLTMLRIDILCPSGISFREEDFSLERGAL